MGQKRTFAAQNMMPALPPIATAKADMKFPNWKFCRGGLRPLPSRNPGHARGRDATQQGAVVTVRAVTVLPDHPGLDARSIYTIDLSGVTLGLEGLTFP